MTNSRTNSYTTVWLVSSWFDWGELVKLRCSRGHLTEKTRPLGCSNRWVWLSHGWRWSSLGWDSSSHDWSGLLFGGREGNAGAPGGSSSTLTRHVYWWDWSRSPDELQKVNNTVNTSGNKKVESFRPPGLAIFLMCQAIDVVKHPIAIQ